MFFLKRQSLQRDIFIYMIPNAISILVGIISFPLIVKNLDVTNYGEFNYLNTIAGCIGMFVGLGLGSPFQQYLYDSQLASDRKRRFLLSLFLFQNISLIIGGCLGVTLFSFLSNYQFLFYFYIFILIYAGNIKSFPTEILRSRRRASIIAFVSVLDRVIYLVGLLFLILLVSIKIDTLLWLGIFRSISIGVVSLAIVSPYMRSTGIAFDLAAVKEGIKIAIPTIPAVVSNWLVAMSDRLFLMHFKGPYDIGIYSGNLAMQNYLDMAMIAIHNATYPVFCKLIGEGNEKNVCRKIEQSLWGFSLLIIAIAFFMKEFLLIMAKPEYYASNVIFLFIGNACFFFFSTHVFQSFVLMGKKIKLIGLAKGSAAVVNVICNFFLIQKFSFVGAAVSTMIAYSISQFFIFKFIGFDKVKSTHYLTILVFLNIILLIHYIITSILYYDAAINFREILIEITFLISLTLIITKSFILTSRRIIP